MIYFDSAATSYPKPASVKKAVNSALVRCGGNPGRSGHKLSMASAAAVYSVREKAAAMFGAQPENVVFTQNCTYSINLALKGFVEAALRTHGSIHLIITELEHNSVARPVYELSKKGVSYSIARVADDDDVTLLNIEECITPETKAIVCTLGSNVSGRLLPYRRIGELCRRHDICFIADGAQVCGLLPVSLAADGINMLCMPGHKGLFGISGTGLLITDGRYPVCPIIEGGTGSTSAELEQTPFMPDSLESGTLNTVGIASVGAGIDFINAVGANNIYLHETALCSLFIRLVEDISGVIVYRSNRAEYLPIVLFNIKGYTSEEAAAELDARGFALRGGLHCSGLAHKALGTFPYGGVRLSPSCFNTPAEVTRLAKAVAQMAKKG